MKLLSKAQLKDLSQMVNAWNPLGLIAQGAPADEYDCLTHALASALSVGASQDKLEALLFDALTTHFGTGPAGAPKMKPSIHRFTQNARTWHSRLENIQ